jgi:hypothetical protein
MIDFHNKLLAGVPVLRPGHRQFAVLVCITICKQCNELSRVPPTNHDCEDLSFQRWRFRDQRCTIFLTIARNTWTTKQAAKQGTNCIRLVPNREYILV